LDLHKTLGVAAITPEPEIATPPLPSVSQERITVLTRQITVLEHERDGIHAVMEGEIAKSRSFEVMITNLTDQNEKNKNVEKLRLCTNKIEGIEANIEELNGRIKRLNDELEETQAGEDEV